MLLFLLLFSTCFPICFAQTVSFSTDQADTSTTAPSFSAFQPTSVSPTDVQDVSFSTYKADTSTTAPLFTTFQPTPVSTTDEQDSLAILHATVTSTEMLNDEASFDVVLEKISDMIREVKPDADFTLTVMSMTEI